MSHDDLRLVNVARATGFWLVAMVGSAAAVCAFWGVLATGKAWRSLAVAAARVREVE